MRLRAAWGRLRGLPWRRIALVSAIVIAVIAVVPPFRRTAALAGSRFVLFVASPLAPGIGGFEALPATTRVLAADGSQLAALDTPAGGRRQPVALRRLPDHVWQSVLAAEDENFYHHGGVDPSAVFRAMVRNAQGRSQGGSTITQQLAKINYTQSEHTVLRKLREVLYAVRLEKKYSKDQLLERYLNQVYLGDRAYGISAASDAYFGVAPEKLSVAQAATLAGMIRGPEQLNPRTHPRAVKARRDAVLRNMARNHWLSGQPLADALASPVQVAPPKPPAATRAPQFVDYVVREAQKLDALGGSPESRGHQLFTGGYTIKTTLDPKAFDGAEAAVRKQLGAPNDPATAVVSVQPGDGAIRAMVSGLDPARKFNLADHPGDGRQPGSAFKPFVYLTALKAGIDPRSTIDSGSPKQLEYRGSRYTVRNYEGTSKGPVTVDDALAHSINTVFAQLVLDVGPPSVVKVAQTAGIDAPDRPLQDDRNRPAIALGGLRHGTTPLEMAAAYATFAAKGKYAEPYSIASIKDRDGRDVYVHATTTRDAFDPREVGVLNAALIGVIDHGTGTGANIGRPAAGKTGTTQNYGDAWFVGFVPQLSTAVWVGNAEKITPMTHVHGRRVTGGSFPASIWAQTMRAALEGVPVQQIPVASPDDLGLQPLAPTTTTSSVPSTTTTSVVGVPTTVPAPAPGQAPPPTQPPATSPSTTRPRPTTTTTRPATTTTQAAKAKPASDGPPATQPP
ncbi:MAG: penicillin-binding protein [Actinomycetota bacterium]